MANKKTTMTDLRIIIRGLASNTSKRKISRDCGISRTSINIYEQRAEESGYTWEELLAMDDAGLHAVLCRPEGHRKPDAEKRRLLEPLIPEYASRLTRRLQRPQVLPPRLRRRRDWHQGNHNPLEPFKPFEPFDPPNLHPRRPSPVLSPEGPEHPHPR